MDINTALLVFEQAAKAHGIATETGNYKLGNKNYNKLIQAINYLKSECQVDRLLNYLNNEDCSVKLWAATYLLPSHEKTALKVLMSLSKEKGLLSLNAETTIEEWQKGNLTIL